MNNWKANAEDVTYLKVYFLPGAHDGIAATEIGVKTTAGAIA